jgi:hypothetical protein
MEGWEDSCWELAMRLREYPTGEEIFEAYWRALIFNRQNLDEELSRNFEWMYKSWNTAFSTSKDESLLELTSIIQRPGNNRDPSPTAILERVQRFSGQMYTGMQFFITYGKLLFKLGLLNKLLSVGQPFENAFFRYAPGRKFCTTKKGFIGWVPLTAQENDMFCFFDDCSLPFVLRSCGRGYKLIGDSYLHGLMNNPLIVLLEKKQNVVLL